MEQNLPLIAKKVWSFVRVIFLMLRKGISKTKLFSDLNTIIKRGKIAGKAFHNLLFHHHYNWVTSTFHHHHHLPFPTPPPCPTDQYEFSCKDTPPNNYHSLSLFSIHKKHQNKHHHHHATPTPDYANDDIIKNAAVMKALEMLTSATASPGFGKSPMVNKQLRITDSPFPLISNGDDEEDGHVVDEAAEKFIIRFYNDLRRQN